MIIGRIGSIGAKDYSREDFGLDIQEDFQDSIESRRSLFVLCSPLAGDAYAGTRADEEDAGLFNWQIGIQDTSLTVDLAAAQAAASFSVLFGDFSE